MSTFCMRPTRPMRPAGTHHIRAAGKTRTGRSDRRIELSQETHIRSPRCQDRRPQRRRGELIATVRFRRRDGVDQLRDAVSSTSTEPPSWATLVAGTRRVPHSTFRRSKLSTCGLRLLASNISGIPATFSSPRWSSWAPRKAKLDGPNAHLERPNAGGRGLHQKDALWQMATRCGGAPTEETAMTDEPTDHGSIRSDEGLDAGRRLRDSPRGQARG